ncbi:MAG: hypothetical protein HUU46_16685 [Candidatus Hydrogenedentes bacterium]|nr:hypothetical protein [Candidatus Hydrogenedentota bacterium]
MAIRRQQIAICVLATLVGHGAAEGVITPELEVSGDHFTVDSQPRFLVFVSYFDAMRASDETLESDFRYLRANGFDGIRIFPNWWDFRREIAFGGDTLLNGKGQIRLERFSALERILELAAQHGLLVDVSFAYETVLGLSNLTEQQVGTSQGLLPVNQVRLDDYEHALFYVAGGLRDYRHIFLDIQNEYNGRITHLSDDEVRRLRAAIKNADPHRLVTASLANEIGPEEVARRSNEVNVDIVGWHESRNPWQFDAMDALVKRARGATTKPIYMGEPALLEDGLTVESVITAVTKAKAGGAAAWTFHTRNGFDLSKQSLVESMTEPERRFAETFKPKLDATPWGANVAAKVAE